MRNVPLQLDIFNAARNGEAAREAERRAMYARPDAPPLVEEPRRRGGWLAAILARAATPAVGRRTGEALSGE
jgi:hypothetical protein